MNTEPTDDAITTNRAAIGGAIASAIEMLTAITDESAAKNYCEIVLSGMRAPFDRAVITFHRPGAPTAHELRTNAEDAANMARTRLVLRDEENAGLRKWIAAAEAELEAWRGGIGKTGRCSRCHHQAPNPDGCALCNVPRLTERVKEGAAAIAELAKLRAEVERLKARPALTAERLAEAMRDQGFLFNDHLAAAKRLLVRLGPVALPAAPSGEVSDEDLLNLYLRADTEQAGIRAVRRVLERATVREAKDPDPERERERAAVGDFIEEHAERLAEAAGEAWDTLDIDARTTWMARVHDVLNHLSVDGDGPDAEVIDGRALGAARTTPPPLTDHQVAAVVQRAEPVIAVLEAGGKRTEWRAPRPKYHDDDLTDDEVFIEHAYWTFDAHRAGRNRPAGLGPMAERDAFKAQMRAALSRAETPRSPACAQGGCPVCGSTARIADGDSWCIECERAFTAEIDGTGRCSHQGVALWAVARSRARSPAREDVALTVGAALAAQHVGAHSDRWVEMREIDEDEEQWVQFRIHRAGDVLLTRYWTGDRWSRADRSAALSAERIGALARLVPLADADAPPESRGPIGGAS